MNQDVKKLWVDALRSGKYSQGRMRLCANNEYCCLGVLCELCPDVDRVDEFNMVSYDGATQYLPNKVADWAGLPKEWKGEYIHDSLASRQTNVYLENKYFPDNKNEYAGLPYFNDNMGWNFNQIADAIEEQL